MLNANPLNEELINGEFAAFASSTDAITFNGYGLQNSNLVTSECDENSGPQRRLTLADIPGDDGQSIELDRLPQKIIKLSGTVFGETALALDSRIDEMKKNLFVKEAVLKITQIGGKVRFYTATLINPQALFAGRSGRDVTRAPFTAQFLCVDPLAREAERDVVSHLARTAATFEFELYNTGNHRTAPVLFLSFDAANTVSKVNVKNDTTDEEIEIAESISTGALLEVNSEEKYVELNGVEKDFDGFFWKLSTGANAITITITSTSHSYNFTGKFFNRYT